MSTNKRFKVFVTLFWALFVLPFFTLFIVLTLISTGNLGFMPSFQELENPKSNLAAEVISCDGKLLGKYYKENRTIVQFGDISPNVLNALLATEDIRFYEHTGIDFRGLGRVFVKTLLLGQSSGGGSTVTQQLAKNLFPRDTTIYDSKIKKVTVLAIAKFKEWLTALKLERNYTKEEILVMYLNTVPFGHNAYGIKSASKIFFNTSPDSLTIEQAATIVGLLKAPTQYSPKRNPKRAFARRNTVLSQMEKYQGELHKLTGYKKLKAKQYDSIRAIPIKLKYQRQDHNEGLATYFREYLRLVLSAEKPDIDNYPEWAHNKYVEDSLEWVTNPLYGWCNKNFKPDGTPYNLYSDGLKIYTSIDSRMQQYAEEAVCEHLGGKESLQSTFDKDIKKRAFPPFSYRISRKEIVDIMNASMRRSERWRVCKEAGMDTVEIRKVFFTPTEMTVFSWKGEKDTVMTPWDSILYYKKFLRVGFMSMEVGTGFVKAYVGGANYNHFKFDHVMVARRQVGSTFKPFVYTLAMMPGGFSPCYKVPNVPVSFDMPPGQQPPTYTPQYSESKLDGQMISLKVGLALSLNQISAWVMKQYSPDAVVEIARKMGVKSPLDPVYALCVGAAEVKLSEMVSAYGTFPNKGIYVEPIIVTRIEDKNGNIISSFKARKNEALDENTAYRMVDMMKGVVDFGTSTRIRHKYGLTNEIAGKTGTTNNNSDGWFIGYVPRLVCGGWVGGEERSIQFSSTTLGQGASMALPIWAMFMQKVYADKSLGYSVEDKFTPAPLDDGIGVDCNDYNPNNGNSNNWNTIDIDGD